MNYQNYMIYDNFDYLKKIWFHPTTNPKKNTKKQAFPLPR
jgi:hypothetical protein